MLLDQEESIVVPVLQKLGVAIPTLIEAIDAEIERYPKQSDATPSFARELNAVLDQAEKNAKAFPKGNAFGPMPGEVGGSPAGTGHQIMKIDDHLTYLMSRVDPDKITPNKTEAASNADLLTDGRASAGGGAGATPTPPARGPGDPR